MTALLPITAEATDVAIDKTARIYIAGHLGMVGSAIVRRLQQGGYSKLITRKAEADGRL